MSSYLVGLIVSASTSIALLVLFQHEERIGFRIFGRTRARLDGYVMTCVHIRQRIFGIVNRNSIRIAFHYILHSFLKFTLTLNKKWEQKVRTMMRTNKNLAQTVDRERTTLSKLEEIALHKATYALTEDEKKKHKDKMLEG